MCLENSPSACTIVIVMASSHRKGPGLIPWRSQMYFPCCLGTSVYAHKQCGRGIMRCKWVLDNEGDIKSLRGANYVVDYMIKIDADLIKCEIAIQLGMAVLWLQNEASAAESRVWILVGVLFCLRPSVPPHGSAEQSTNTFLVAWSAHNLLIAWLVSPHRRFYSIFHTLLLFWQFFQCFGLHMF